MATAAIQATNLVKRYGTTPALGGVSFVVPTGRLFGIIGADGAGKTTLIKVIATLLAPDSGSVRVLDRDVIKQYRDIRASIGYMPQRFSLYEDLSVIENMVFFADLFGVSGRDRSERLKRLLAFSRLGPFADRRARNLSGGMKQKLALSCALIHTPDLLVLDEPTTGVDPLSRREFWTILRDLNARGMTIVVSTPYMSEAEHCQELLLMHRGAILHQGSPNNLVAGFPQHLYRVSSSTASLHVPIARSALHAGIRIYPVAGALHVAVDPANRMHESAVLEAVRAVAPAADAAKRIEPRVEDLLFYHIERDTEKAAP